MKKSTFIAVLTLLFSFNLVSAQSFPDTWEAHDLSKYGMSFSFYAPSSASFDWDGDSEELYIDAGDDGFRMMIAIYEESVEELVAEFKEEVEDPDYFDLVGFVHDEDNGFLAQEDIDGDSDYVVYYAFRKGSKTFFFQTNPLMDGAYSAENAELMFQACKTAAGL